MNVKKLEMIIIGLLILSGFMLLAPKNTVAQTELFKIHDRGILHQTLYNSGIIGRPHQYGEQGYATSVPLMEYPAPSGAFIDGIEYDGKHNILGAGMWMAAEADDTTSRMEAYSGALGSSDPVRTRGRWSFGYSIEKIENYPLTEDGDINPDYNPDEAEEIIIAEWGTSIGLSVKRTSRVWSFPGYDSFIIYEYEIEHTGDRDGNPNTLQSTDTLYDVSIAFAYAFAPNMFGYQRQNRRWDYEDYYRNDQRARFDYERWMGYNLHMNGLPDPEYYEAWGETGEMGGGSNAGAAVGFMVLNYDKSHLTHKDERHNASVIGTDTMLVWTEDGKMKQPWGNRIETGVLDEQKIQNYLRVDLRRSSTWGWSDYETRQAHEVPREWWGRSNFNHRQSRKAIGRFITFAPYTLAHGDKIRFSIAELAGYGAATKEQTEAGLRDWGGSCGEDCGEEHAKPEFPVPNWSEPVTYGGPNDNFADYGSTYLSEYDLPPWVNENVVTIRDVADKVLETYHGEQVELPVWPAEANSIGDYKIPSPVPAPVIEVVNDPRARNNILWKRSAEDFDHPRLKSSISHYLVQKARHPLGPWQTLAEVEIGDMRYLNEENKYVVMDEETRVGEEFYYSVLSIDQEGNPSGRTNISRHETTIGATEELEEVYAVPNPFVVRSGFEGGDQADDRIGFYNLPDQARIRIYSYSGQLVEVIDHDSPTYSTAWFQVTRSDQEIASGVYFYVVETPDGNTTHGKFTVIK